MMWWSRNIRDNYPILEGIYNNDVLLLSFTLVLFFVVLVKRLYALKLCMSILLLFFNMFFIIDLPIFFFQWLQYPRFDHSLFIRVISLIIGVWGLIRSIKEVMVTILRSDAVVDSWNYIVKQGAGRGDSILGTIERAIIDTRMPGVTTRREPIAIELFGEKRPFLVVQNLKYKEYKMYINARDFGVDLDVSWYFMAEPHYLKRTMSKYATGDPQDMTMRVSLFAQQDLSAFKSVTHDCVIRVVEELGEELKLDPMGLNNTRSRGFLNVW